MKQILPSFTPHFNGHIEQLRQQEASGWNDARRVIKCVVPKNMRDLTHLRVKAPLEHATHPGRAVSLNIAKFRQYNRLITAAAVTATKSAEA